MRERILAGIAGGAGDRDANARVLQIGGGSVSEEIEFFGSAPSMCAGLVDAQGRISGCTRANLRFRGADGSVVVDAIAAADYATYIGEATERDSYLKSPYFRPMGYPQGEYRVGPLARMNVVDHCGTPAADAEFTEFHQRFGTDGA